MTDKYKDLRDALSAGPTPGPWERHKTGGYTKCVRQASPTGAGRGICSTFVQNTPKTEEQHERQRAQNNLNSEYIATANPETIRALLAERDELEAECVEQARLNGMGSEREARLMAERDALRKALQKVRPVIAADRQGLIDVHGLDGQIPADDEPGRLGLYEYDGALHVIDAALAQHQGEKHGDV